LEKKQWLGETFIANKLFHEERTWPNPPLGTKPDLFIHKKVLEPLRRALGPGLDTVQGVPDVCLETYFDIHLVGKQGDGKTVTGDFQDGEETWKIKPIFAMHVFSSSEEMPSYGVSLQHESGYNVLMRVCIHIYLISLTIWIRKFKKNAFFIITTVILRCQKGCFVGF